VSLLNNCKTITWIAPTGQLVPSHSELISFSEWQVSEIGKLSLILYPKTKLITLNYHDKKKTHKYKDVLSDNCIELLIRHNKHLEHNEAQIGYYESDIYDATKGMERSNRQIVYDFNSDLRKLFQIAKEVKPFEWIGKGKTRSLKANFNLKVKY